MNNISKSSKQRGAVSLFVVIFTALLITVITVSFVRIMIQNQQQSTAVDLSQSAYDSVQVGVEDAKRVLLRYQRYCSLETPANCSAEKKIIFDPLTSTCTSAVKTLADVAVANLGEEEIKVQSSNTVNALDQAYTCVKIITDTEDFEGKLTGDESKIIPLRSVSPISSISVEWFTADDSNMIPPIVSLDSISGVPPLLAIGSWNINKPSIMRTQLIQFGSNGFNLNDFDKNTSSNSNVNTLFLYPSTVGAANPDFSSKDVRREVNDPSPIINVASPVAVKCLNNFDKTYACPYENAAAGTTATKIILPEPINGGSRTAYLRLNALYKTGTTNYRVKLYDVNGIGVAFDNVQPSIDSTGRANDLFRRVRARVEYMDPGFPYPEAAIDLTGNLCKDFQVTDDPADYVDKCTSTP